MAITMACHARRFVGNTRISVFGKTQYKVSKGLHHVKFFFVCAGHSKCKKVKQVTQNVA